MSIYCMLGLENLISQKCQCICSLWMHKTQVFRSHCKACSVVQCYRPQPWIWILISELSEKSFDVYYDILEDRELFNTSTNTKTRAGAKGGGGGGGGGGGCVVVEHPQSSGSRKNIESQSAKHGFGQEKKRQPRTQGLCAVKRMWCRYR
jgi:hypothetical protein